MRLTVKKNVYEGDSLRELVGVRRALEGGSICYGYSVKGKGEGGRKYVVFVRRGDFERAVKAIASCIHN